MSITKAHRQEIRQLKRRQGRVAQRKVLWKVKMHP